MKRHKFEFLVIGGGPGGTSAAMALATAGKSVMLVEKGEGLGGTCLFEGCIPSKIFRESSRRLSELREAGQFGLCLPTQDFTVNWSAIQERKRTILQQRSEISLHKADKLTTLETVFGHCRLLNSQSAIIENNTAGDDDDEAMEVHFEKAIISTGSLPFIAPIKGRENHHVYNSESILKIDHIPKRLVVIGGGPIGVELGQIFKTLGAEVSVLEITSRILESVDEEIVERLQQKMSDDGIDIVTDCKVQAIEATGHGVFVEYTVDGGKEQHKIADTVLMATGRRPNVESLGLENTGIQYDTQGIAVNEKLETSEKGIYAIGDVIGKPMFAHWATAQGLALARYLLGKPVMFPDVATNTAVIFSSPEIGIAGLSEQQAIQTGMDVQVARYDFKQDARAQITGTADGVLKIIFESDNRRVVGVHIMVEGAANLMGEAALLIKSGALIEAVAAAIHPHPTLSESFVMAVRNIMAQSANDDTARS